MDTSHDLTPLLDSWKLAMQAERKAPAPSTPTSAACSTTSSGVVTQSLWSARRCNGG